jgi:arylsulfatase A-like enzyme/thioredoxin-like negative regulator of GroEL
LLITIDTLRADRLGCYGWTNARTPVLDSLARRGVRFTRAYATAPITLTSHASLLTGRYPPGHGARHNGIAMQPDLPTLATRFKDAGFETGAFVSAFPLDRRFGLTRGFDTYDDELPRDSNGRPNNERPGAATVDRALAWMRGRAQAARVFAWVHLFEPHAPYGTADASIAGSRSAGQRYDDEVAVADREVGRLLEGWRDLDRTLVVVAADHGEAFGEHSEIGHSIFIYDTTLHVPVIFAGAGAPAGVAVDVPLTLADIAPTLTAWSKLPGMDADGIDLGPSLDGVPAGDRILYAESFAPLLDFGWAPLRSVRRNGVKFIAAPRAELYDVGTDPHEQANVVADRADLARELAARVDRMSGPELPARAASADPEVRARLRALGYAGGGPSGGRERPDPKDRIAIASRMAEVTSGELKGAAAEAALNAVLRQDAGNVQAHVRLGFLMADNRRCEDAERHFAAAIAGGLPSADAHLGLAGCQAARGAASAALATFRDARRVEPGNPVVEANIGLLELEAGRPEPAIHALRQALQADPNLHQARFALARALARTGQRAPALSEATDLLRRLPAGAPQRPEVERLIAALRPD